MVIQQSNRDYSIDFLKTIAIFLVIYGHSISHIDIGQVLFWNNSQYKFIYIFHMPVFIFISGYLFNINNDTLFIFCYKKCIRLLMPAITMTPFVWLAQYLVHGTGGTLKGFLSFLINDFWFLKCLFVCSIIAFICLKYFRNNLLLLIPLIVMIVLPVNIPYFVVYMYPFFILGYYAKIYALKDKVILHKFVFFIIALITFAIIFCNWNFDIYMYNHCCPV
jgi:fucose 4-O-acetylase-like acetyltransferase